MPTAGDGEIGRQMMPGRDSETGMRLVDMAGFSLTDLSGMDDLAVAEILDGLTSRRRCGIGAEERYVAQQGGVGRCAQ